MHIPEKLSWLERAKETHEFHISTRKENHRWRLKDTVKILNRSIGSISEDLKIASWCKTHKEQLEKFSYAKDALEWIKDKEDKLKIRDLE